MKGSTKNRVKNIQAAAYNGAYTIYGLIFIVVDGPFSSAAQE